MRILTIRQRQRRDLADRLVRVVNPQGAFCDASTLARRGLYSRFDANPAGMLIDDRRGAHRSTPKDEVRKVAALKG